ncbi:MAG: hypothetical protein Kow0069_29420 [Promethearchaeota archaeon]
MAFDVDDTLVRAVAAPDVGTNAKKFDPLPPDQASGCPRLVDSPGRAQVLVPHAAEVLDHLHSMGVTLALVSMGPEWQVRRLLAGFGVDHLFDWELGDYDRRDKAEKVQLVVEHYNDRLAASVPFNREPPEPALRPDQVAFVDDNLSYLARVDQAVPGVKLVWAHYATGDGLRELYRDLWEEHGTDLVPEWLEAPWRHQAPNRRPSHSKRTNAPKK